MARSCPTEAFAARRILIRTARISCRVRTDVLTHDLNGLSPNEFSHFDPKRDEAI
jgi:hypothetical protein